MYKIFFTVACLLWSSFNTLWACDVCACSAGSSLSGLLPGAHRSFVGLQYLQRSFSSQHIPSLLSPDRPAEKSEEQLRTMSLGLRLVVHPRLQLFAQLPFQRFSQQKESGQLESTGLGDANVRFLYSLVKRKDSARARGHELLAGAGLKAPTGSFDLNGDISSPNLQPGTGAWDWMAKAAYSAQVGRVQIMAQGEYTFRGTGPDAYQYGDFLSSKLQGFYRIDAGRQKILPFAGISWLQVDKDKVEGRVQKYSGGYLNTLGFGTRVFWQSMSLRIEAELPVTQRLSQNLVQNNYQLGIDLAFFI